MRCNAGALLIALLNGCVICSSPSLLLATSSIVETRCASQSNSPVLFRIDCSHVKAATVLEACGRFIENQACKVFPAYRKITGIQLEKSCPTITYTIYDADNFPHSHGEGGLALHCAVDYMADYSIKSRAGSVVGPYDVHELLHLYHSTLGALPALHILFAPSMTEATRLIGDEDGYRQKLAQLKDEARRLSETAGKNCVLAEIFIEEALYGENSENVYQFYSNLVIGRAKEQSDREARFARMYVVAYGGKAWVRQFLVEHRCPGL